MSSYAIDEHQRVARQLGERLKIGSGDQRITTRPQQTQDRRAQAGLADLVALLRATRICIWAACRAISVSTAVFPIPGSPETTTPAGSMVVGPPHHAQPGRQHVISAAQRP
jgi:hypothetical protein